jgi:hypothetical protein
MEHVFQLKNTKHVQEVWVSPFSTVSSAATFIQRHLDVRFPSKIDKRLPKRSPRGNLTYVTLRYLNKPEVQITFVIPGRDKVSAYKKVVEDFGAKGNTYLDPNWDLISIET